MTRRKAEPHIDHEIATVASFRRNPDYAAEYLNAVLEDGDREDLLLALRRIAEAFGGVSKLAALRSDRDRYCGVLAPNSPLRAAVTARALAAATTPPAAPPEPPAAAEPAHRRAARYAWALLLARIYEVFPLLCPKCGGELRILAFLTDDSTVRDILAHLGEPTAPPRIAPARSPPLWEATGAEHDPSADPALLRAGLRVRPAPHLVATTAAARLCATPGWLVPAPARLPARGHPGVGTRAEVRRQGCGAARCRRISTLDPHHRPQHNQTRVIKTPIR